MPTLTVDVPHTLGQQQATQRLKNQFGEVKDKFAHHVSDLVEKWDGHVLSFGFRALGVQVQGTVTSGESEVKVAAELPPAAMLFRRTIERQIRDQLGRILL